MLSRAHPGKRRKTPKCERSGSPCHKAQGRRENIEKYRTMPMYFAMAIEGSELSSVELADRINSPALSGRSHIVCNRRFTWA